MTIPDIPMTLLVSTLRDRILQHSGSAMPVWRIRLTYSGKTLTNQSSIGLYNLEDEDIVVLSLRDPKKK